MQVKELVKNKQFEFVNAGWCMNDEGSTHYNAIIDQMSLGKYDVTLVVTRLFFYVHMICVVPCRF